MGGVVCLWGWGRVVMTCHSFDICSWTMFSGANVARLVVPLRFGAAFALAPWVEENVCQRFGIGGGREGA